MRISMIVAMAEQRVIGCNNRMPWHLPADLQQFKRLTMGKAIIMGRKTHESIGKALPGRRNIVISRNPDVKIADCEVFISPEHALKQLEREDVAAVNNTEGVKTFETSEVMIIGGAALYAHCLPLVQRLYISRIHAVFDGDRFFPDYQKDFMWQERQREEHPADENTPFAWTFLMLDRQ